MFNSRGRGNWCAHTLRCPMRVQSREMPLARTSGWGGIETGVGVGVGCGQKLQPGPVNTDNGRSAACLSFDKRLHSRSRRHRGESVCVSPSFHSLPPTGAASGRPATSTFCCCRCCSSDELPVITFFLYDALPTDFLRPRRFTGNLDVC